jgi:hypothetical protein
MRNNKESGRSAVQITRAPVDTRQNGDGSCGQNKLTLDS